MKLTYLFIIAVVLLLGTYFYHQFKVELIKSVESTAERIVKR